MSERVAVGGLNASEQSCLSLGFLFCLRDARLFVWCFIEYWYLHGSKIKMSGPNGQHDVACKRVPCCCFCAAAACTLLRCCHCFHIIPSKLLTLASGGRIYNCHRSAQWLIVQICTNSAAHLWQPLKTKKCFESGESRYFLLYRH
jgi:hypothetical protein